MTSVLFVCLGNICRSPLAEALFQHHVKTRGLERYYRADSCGTAPYHIGDTPDPRTLANATRNGVTIRHRGRQFGPDDFRSWDMIFAMDKSNCENILRLDTEGQYHEKVRLMRAFDATPGDGQVPDPYHGNEKDFQEVFDILYRSTEALILSLEERRLRS